MSNSVDPATCYGLSHRWVAEFVVKAFLVSTVVGSGIVGEKLADDAVLALPGNTIPAGAILVGLITILGPISAAHFNPAVTLAFAVRREISAEQAVGFVMVQMLGGVAGCLIAYVMFEFLILLYTHTVRTGTGQWIAVVVAISGLVATILARMRFRNDAVPWLVSLHIAAAYWFTVSTSFANTAAAIAKGFSYSFSIIRPTDAPGFIACEVVGALMAAMVFGGLLGGAKKHSESSWLGVMSAQEKQR